MTGDEGAVNFEGLLKEWRELEAFVTKWGEPPFEPLSSDSLVQLEEHYSLHPPLRALFEAGWPTRPLLIGGTDPFFWAVEELLSHATNAPDWRRDWFPFGIMSGFEVLCTRVDADDPPGVWALWNEAGGDSSHPETALHPEGLVYRSLEAFIAAVRINWEWIREEHLESREAGWFLFKERYPTLTTDAAEAIARAFSPHFKDGPAILPCYASYADLLDPPLNCIATPLDERL